MGECLEQFCRHAAADNVQRDLRLPDAASRIATKIIFITINDCIGTQGGNSCVFGFAGTQSPAHHADGQADRNRQHRRKHQQ